MAIHSQFTGDELHEAFHFVQEADPGAVGANKYWLKVSTGALKRRNPDNSGWDEIGGATGMIDPTSAKGDLIVRGASAPATRLPVGTNGQVLVADSTQILGLRWGTNTSSVPDWVSNSVDNVPSSPNAMDDEFTSGSLDAKWTWYNQGSAAYSAINSLARFDINSTGGRSVRWVTQPIPVGNWRVVAKMSPFTKPSSTTSGASGTGWGRLIAFGLGVRTSGDTKSLVHYLTFDSSWRSYIQQITGNTFVDTPFYFDSLKQQDWYWLALEKNGTNFIFSISLDGNHYFPFAQQAAATYVGTADQVGFCMDAQSGPAFVGIVDYFRRTA